MAKTIKFNLICDEKPVRTIEDLQNNFSIEDVLEYYYNGLLQRWLKVRGYETELEKVSAITTEDSMEIIKELIKIFEVSVEEEEVEESIYMLKFLEERKESYEIYRKQDIATKQIIEDYESGYQNLINEILEEPDNAARIKANIEEIMTNYEWAFELNHRKIFWELVDENFLLAMMCLLMNKKSRTYFLESEGELEPKELGGPIIHADESGKLQVKVTRQPQSIVGDIFARQSQKMFGDIFEEVEEEVEEERKNASDVVSTRNKSDKFAMYNIIKVKTKETKLKDILGESLGRVLYINDFNLLMEEDNNEYILDALLKFIDENKTKVIVALSGDGDKLRCLYAGNSDFSGRFPLWLNFSPYNLEQLIGVARYSLKEKGFVLNKGTD